ncbi:hypothetical protein, partial [Saccharophagus degradans]
GYWWNKNHKFNFGIQGNWYSFQTINVVGVYDDEVNLTGVESIQQRVDQYHVYFTVQTKF